MKTMKKFVCLVLVLTLCLTALPVQAAGFGNSDAPVTRAMISSAIWTLEGEPVVN